MEFASSRCREIYQRVPPEAGRFVRDDVTEATRLSAFSKIGRAKSNSGKKSEGQGVAK